LEELPPQAAKSTLAARASKEARIESKDMNIP
jgi:hypothetical protein